MLDDRHVQTIGQVVHKIRIAEATASWGTEAAQVFRNDMAMVVMRGSPTPYFLYILRGETPHGWGALLSAHTAQFQGFCRRD